MAPDSISVPGEVWKQIPGYDNYLVSNLGRIWSMPRLARRTWSSTGMQYFASIGGKLLNPYSQGRNGRIESLRVGLWRDDVQTPHLVHRLVLLAFAGEPPEGTECCHNDGNAANNRLENLRWDTRKANRLDSVRHGTSGRPGLKGEAHPMSKINVDTVRRIRSMRGRKHVEIAADLSISTYIVKDVLSGKTWSHVH